MSSLGESLWSTLLPRAILGGVAGGCAIALLAGEVRAQKPPEFTKETVRALAAEMAGKPYVAPVKPSAEKAGNLNYDQFRDIRFRSERAIWRGEGLGFELHLLPLGWLYGAPVDIHLVENGVAQRIEPKAEFFDYGPLAGKPAPEIVGFSGFRLNGPLNRLDLFDEIAVFQGASYFRGVSKGQVYGLSARGLAIDTAEAKGEEFPDFRSFWIERPKAGDGKVVVHALLDSASTTGAYTFTIQGGAPTTMDVEATLYPRRELTHAGLAPLTSMFLFSPADTRLRDYRPAVNDSDGLAIENGNGERVWRPLTNPKRLQASAFSADNPRGFGLIQRSRDFADYQDLEAHYERRPSAWITPKGAWGKGNVILIEIPTEEEIHDNVVAFWRPAAPIAKGTPLTLNYEIAWSQDVPGAWAGATVRRTAVGAAIGRNRKSGLIQFVVDFGGGRSLDAGELLSAHVTANSGTVSEAIVQPHVAPGVLRTTFMLDPKNSDVVELRLVVRSKNQPISETWLYRWVR